MAAKHSQRSRFTGNGDHVGQLSAVAKIIFNLEGNAMIAVFKFYIALGPHGDSGI